MVKEVKFVKWGKARAGESPWTAASDPPGSRWIKAAADWEVGDIPTGREEACATGLPLPPAAALAPNGATQSRMVVDSRG